MKVGDELYIEPVDDDVDPNRQFLFDVAFDHPGVVDDDPALQVLRRLAVLVDLAVSELERFM